MRTRYEKISRTPRRPVNCFLSRVICGGRALSAAFKPLPCRDDIPLTRRNSIFAINTPLRPSTNVKQCSQSIKLSVFTVWDSHLIIAGFCVIHVSLSYDSIIGFRVRIIQRTLNIAMPYKTLTFLFQRTEIFICSKTSSQSWFFYAL